MVLGSRICQAASIYRRAIQLTDDPIFMSANRTAVHVYGSMTVNLWSIERGSYISGHFI